MIGKFLLRIVDTGLLVLLLCAALESFRNPWMAFRMGVIVLLTMIVIELKRKGGGNG